MKTVARNGLESPILHMLAAHAAGTERPAETSAGPWDAECDWAGLVSALDLNLRPLLYRFATTKRLTETMPADVRDSLRESYCSAFAVGGKMLAGLGQISSALSEARVETITLKGAALAPLVYPDWATRPMADIDFLVKRDSLARAESCLTDLGYKPLDSADAGEWFKRNHFHFRYVSEADERAPVVEIHWDILPAGDLHRVDVDRMWERSITMPFEGASLRIFRPEDLIVHAAMHFSYHTIMGLAEPPLKLTRDGFRNHLKDLYDISQIANSSLWVVDWGLLADIAGDFGIKKYLLFVLRLAERLLGLEVPAEFFLKLGDGRYATGQRALVESVARMILHPQEARANQLRVRRAQWLWAEGVRNKMRVLEDLA